MAEERILDVQPDVGKVTKFHALDEDHYAVETVYDIEPVVEDVTQRRNNQPTRIGEHDRYLGSIPMTMWAELKRLGVLKDPVALQRWFNEYNKLRGWTGRFA